MVLRALAFCFLVTGSLSGGLIHLKTREIDTERERGEAAVAPILRLEAERRHIIIEFNRTFRREDLDNLTSRGAVITNALNARSVMAAVPDGLNLRGLNISWTGVLRPGDKLSPELNRLSLARSGWVVEFHSDVTVSAQTQIVDGAGLAIVPQATELPHQMVVIGDASQLEALSRWDEVAYIFPASATLLAGGMVFPCEGALVTGQNAAQYVTTSTGWSPNTPSGVTLGYVFTSLTTQLPQNQVESQIVQAMRSWTAVANVQFAAGTDSAAPVTVAIEFGTTVNGDPTPFTSTSTLAHTYYPAPPNPEPIAGDMHFNPLEAWHIGSPFDVYSVALHELGHSLGLGHTDNPSDVMYPYYQYGIALSPNDIAGVQSLYGPPVTVPPVITSTPVPVAPLAVLVSSPLDGLRTSAASVDVSGSVANASGGLSVVWQSSNGGSGHASGGTLWTVTGIALTPGINLISVTATDAASRSVSQELRILRTTSSSPPAPDLLTNAPSLTITSPSSGTTTAENSITVEGTASGLTAVSLVSWETNSGASGNATGTFSWTTSAIPLFPGENAILIRATDADGNDGWSQIEITRK